MKQLRRFRKRIFMHGLCAVTALSLVLFAASCNQKPKDNNKKKDPTPPPLTNTEFAVTFAPDGTGGTMTAVVDDKLLKSGDKVKKGTVVKFTAKPDTAKDFKVEKWSGNVVVDKTNPNKATLTVIKDSDVKVKFKHEINIGKFCTDITVFGGKDKGRLGPHSNEEEAQKILGGENITVKIKGSTATILVTSASQKLKEVKINEQNCEIKGFSMLGAKSVAVADISLGEPKNITSVKIDVTSEKGEKASSSFKIERIPGLVDIPDVDLYINDIDPTAFEILTGGNTWVDMQNAEQPPKLFGTEPSKIRIEAIHDNVHSVIIDGKDAGPIKKKIFDAGNDTQRERYYVEADVTGISPTKKVTVTIKPKDAKSYQDVVLKFELVIKEKIKIGGITYSINDKYKDNLPPDFVTGLEKGTNPLLTVNSNFINLKLISRKFKLHTINVNGTDFKDSKDDGKDGGLIQRGTKVTLFFNSIKLNNAGETQVTIVAKAKNPLLKVDDGSVKDWVLKFRVKKDTSTVKEKIVPKLTINDIIDLPKATFLDKLTDMSNPPLYEAKMENAKLVFAFKEYQGKFIVGGINVNGTSVPIKEVITERNTIVYTAETTIPVQTSTETTVTVKFEPKSTDMAEPLEWKFRLKNNNVLPSIPKSDITLRVNEKGGFTSPFEQSFNDYLTDNANPPLLTLDAKKAALRILTDKKELLEKVKFTVDNAAAVEKNITSTGFIQYEAAYDVSLNDTNEHLIKIEMLPKDTTKYSSLVYTFKLKSSGNLPPLTNINFGINGKRVSHIERQKSEYTATLNAESATLTVQSNTDVMASVMLNDENCTIEKKTKGNVTWWEVVKEVKPTVGASQDFKFTVTPKDTDNYRERVYTFHLTGKKIEDNNAEFLYENNKPVITYKTFWKYGSTDREYTEKQELEGSTTLLKDVDFGALKAQLFDIKTVSPRATVYYKLVDPVTGNIIGSETLLIKTGNTWKSAEISLYENKPTKIVCFVKAENNNTDDSKGKMEYLWNPMQVRWDKNTHSSGNEYHNQAYDIITVRKSELTTNKLYLAFLGGDKYGRSFEINTSYKYPPFQTEPSKLDSVIINDIQWRWYGVTVDLSAQNGEIEVVCPIKRGSLLKFDYKVKIKIED